MYAATSICSTDVSSVMTTGGTPIVIKGHAIANLKEKAWVRFSFEDKVWVFNPSYILPTSLFDLCCLLFVFSTMKLWTENSSMTKVCVV